MEDVSRLMLDLPAVDSLTDITPTGVGIVMGLCGCQVVFQEKDLVWT